MTDRRRPEMMMPVADDQALRLAEIEALRAIRDSVQSHTRQTEALTNEVREQGKMIGDVRERVIRIESNRVSEDVAKLKEEVDMLKADKLRREGALGVGNWLARNWPFLIGLLALIGVVLKANGQL
jgi:hypothetical protein